MLLLGLSSHCREWGPLSSCGSRASHCDGFCCCRAWGLGWEGFSRCVSWAQEHRLNSCGAWAWWSTTFGIFLDQELNPHLLCRQADSSSLSHQGRPQVCVCHAHEPSSFGRMKSPIGVRMYGEIFCRTYTFTPFIANSFEKHCIGPSDCLSNSNTVRHPPSSRIGHHFSVEHWIQWGGLGQGPRCVILGIFRSYCREMLTSWVLSGEGDHQGRVDSGSLLPTAPRRLLYMWKVWNLLILWLRLLFWGASLVVHD